MPRYRITIEYDGTPFVGWQLQAVGASVQGALAQAAEKLCGSPVVIKGAGRTDAGVHAMGQVAHFDLPRAYPADTVRNALNFHLKPHPVAVLDCAEVDDTFDARFSATARHYRYRLLPRRAPPALERHRVWWLPHGVDADRMHAAAQVLVGRHDFTTFRAAGCQAKSPVKTLDVLDVAAREDGEVWISASARSFLHSQVRSLVGSLKLVGEGRWNADDLRAALEARERAACGPVAPAAGLYLMRVDYGPQAQRPGAVDNAAETGTEGDADEE
jgi:tRNA pseudouridine38-40 synthase